MSENAVLLDVEDGIATITLNRPDEMNSLSPAIVSGIDDALDRVAEHDDARCVVLEGAGRAFCAGGDISGMDDDETTGHERMLRIVDISEKIPVRLYNYELPTVAKIDGYCLGAGVGVALSCDVQLASERAQLGLVFRNVGLTLDFATSYLVPQYVGPNVARELALTGEILPADEAEELGLLNHVYDEESFESESQELIETIATGPTVALHHSTRNINLAPGSSIREAAEREARSQKLASNTEDHTEGVEAFAEDREPNFQGR